MPFSHTQEADRTLAVHGGRGDAIHVAPSPNASDSITIPLAVTVSGCAGFSSRLLPVVMRVGFFR